jgi:ubiquitin-conjugating enzyme E2 W
MSSHAALPAMAIRRIQKEAERFNDETSNELRLEVRSGTVWLVHIKGVSGTIYEGENFVLQVTFDAKYPMECPEVLL